MPSSKALTNVHVGAGKLHPNVATAAADYQMSGGTEALLASMVSAINQEVASPTFTTVSLTAGDLSTTLNGSVLGPIWLGNSGEVAKDLFDIVSATDDSRVSGQTSKLPLYVTGITGGTVGTGAFTSATLTLNFNAGVPTTTTYKIRYSKRMTVGSFDTGSLATTRRFSPKPPIFEREFEKVKWGLSGTLGAWDDTPSITLYNSALSGLNERYNRATSVSGSPVLDGAGDGGLIDRTGQAVTARATTNVYNYSAPQPDPYLALFKTRAGPSVATTTVVANKDGGSGFVGVLQQRVTALTGQLTNAEAITTASRIDVIERYLNANVLGIAFAKVRTKIIPGITTGTALNPDAGAGVDDVRTIRLATGHFFWESSTGDDLSEVAIGHDMIEVTLPTGERQVYVITKLFGGPHASSPVPGEDQQRALVRTLTGDSPAFPSGAATTGVSFRFIKTKLFEGVGSQRYRAVQSSQTDPVLLGYMYHAVTPILTDDPTSIGSNEIDPGRPEFYARGRTKKDTGNTGIYYPYALTFGGHNSLLHVQESRGALRGDGAVECSLVNKTVSQHDISSNTTVTWHPTLDGSVLDINFTNGTGTVLLTVNLDTDYVNNVMKDGDEITVLLRNPANAATQGGAGGIASYGITWPTEFEFSGVEAYPQPYNDVSGRTIYKYHGVFTSRISKFLMSLTSYLGAGG